jgi:hypothetical protein
MPTDNRWEYHCPAGMYYDTTLRGLLWAIVSHRFWHWKRGEGWID